ncbi:hypothetical protein ACFLSQ_07845 [Bacteroidota bacterium]
MRLLINIISILIILLLSCDEATITPWLPPTQKPTEFDSLWGDYFPNTPDTEWEYDIKINSQPSGTAKIKIEKRVLILDTISASLWKFEEPGRTYSNYVAIIGDSVFFYTDINDISKNKKILKSYILPLDNYHDWKVRSLDQSFGSDNASGGSLTGSITVPAGKFDEVYEIERITDAQDRKAHEWIKFVPDVGMIMRETIDNSTNETTVWELKSYIIEKTL